MWLYLPKENLTSPVYPSAQALEGWISDCILQNPDIALWAMSSETLTARPLSWPGWQTRPWLMHLSGMTLKPSTAARGAARYLSSLADIHVSPSPCQDGGSEKMIPAISGPMSGASSAKLRPSGSSSRTSSVICPLVSKTSPETFKAWALELQRASRARRKLVQATSASGTSYWATPTYKMGGNRCTLDLTSGHLRFRLAPNQKGSQLGLRMQAISWSLLWIVLRMAGWEGQPFQSLPRLPVTFHPGTARYSKDLSLNPAFTDWIMGWPIGWSDPQQPVTEWRQWLRRGRGGI